MAPRSGALERRVPGAPLLRPDDCEGPFQRLPGNAGPAPGAGGAADDRGDEPRHGKRDKHLRSADFFGVEQSPQLRFVSDSATLTGERLKVTGTLHAAGASVPIELDAALRTVDGEPEIEAVTEVDQRLLGMTWSPMGITRTPTKLIVRGRLTR